MISSNRKAILAAIATILIWSSAFVGTRVCVRYLSPENLALYRFLIASSILAFYAFAVKRISLPDKKDMPFLVLTGFLGIAVYMYIFNSGQKKVTAATGAFILGSAPLFTSLFSALFLKEKIELKTIAGIIVSFCGIAVICFFEKDGISLNTGIFIMLAAAVLISIYSIMVKKSTRKYTSLLATTWAFISGTVFLLTFSPSLFNEIRHLPLNVHLTVVYLAVFPATIAYVLWAYALSKGNTARISSFMYVTPLLTIAVGWIWIGEIPGIFSIIGGMIIIAGVIVTNLKQNAGS